MYSVQCLLSGVKLLNYLLTGRNDQSSVKCSGTSVLHLRSRPLLSIGARSLSRSTVVRSRLPKSPVRGAPYLHSDWLLARDLDHLVRSQVNHVIHLLSHSNADLCSVDYPLALHTTTITDTMHVVRVIEVSQLTPLKSLRNCAAELRGA